MNTTHIIITLSTGLTALVIVLVILITGQPPEGAPQIDQAFMERLEERIASGVRRGVEEAFSDSISHGLLESGKSTSLPALEGQTPDRKPMIPETEPSVDRIVERLEAFLHVNAGSADAMISRENPTPPLIPKNHKSLATLAGELITDKETARRQYFLWSRQQIHRKFGAPDYASTQQSGAVDWHYTDLRSPSGDLAGISFRFQEGVVISISW